MKKSNKVENAEYLRDLKFLLSTPTPKRYAELLLHEYPFDLQLLNMSPLYRRSRKLYGELGGIFTPRLCSSMRGLSAQDLFKDEIDYSPGLSELLWFRDFGHRVGNAEDEIFAFSHFNEISVFHEQNHRIIWRLLPPAPTEQGPLLRYLNFAESLVVALDLAMADELGKKYSQSFERLKVIYRPGGEDKYYSKSKAEYRKYLLALVTSTYYILETMHLDDILKAVDYVLPSQRATNRAAVRRGQELSEIFVRVTNPQWQSLYWQSAREKLLKIQKKMRREPLVLPSDPLDLENELNFADEIFDFYGV